MTVGIKGYFNIPQTIFDIIYYFLCYTNFVMATDDDEGYIFEDDEEDYEGYLFARQGTCDQFQKSLKYSTALSKLLRLKCHCR